MKTITSFLSAALLLIGLPARAAPLLAPRQAANVGVSMSASFEMVDYIQASKTVGTVVYRYHGLTRATNVFRFVDITNRPVAPKAQVVISWTNAITLLESTNLFSWSRLDASTVTAVKLPMSSGGKFFKVPLPNQSVSLSWDASPSPDVTGFRVYWGTNSGIYFRSADAGANTNYAVSNLLPGWAYYFAATAYDNDGNESGLSIEVSYLVPVNEIKPSIEAVP